LDFLIHTLTFVDGFSKNSQISNFTKVLSVVAELFDADRKRQRQTDGRTDEANSHSRNFANASKNGFGIRPSSPPMTSSPIRSTVDTNIRIRLHPVLRPRNFDICRKCDRIRNVELLLSYSVINYTYDSEEKLLAP